MARSKTSPLKGKRKKVWGGEISPDMAAEFGLEVPAITSIERTLSPNQIGEVLGLTGEAVKQWIYQRRLPAVKQSNGYWKIRITDLEKYLSDRQPGGVRAAVIASNDETTISVMGECLRLLNVNPIRSQSAIDCLLKCSNVTPALIIVDVESDEEAWWLIDKIRYTQSPTRALAKIPLVLITSAPLSPEQLDKAVAMEIKACVEKPIDARVLEREVKRLLNLT